MITTTITDNKFEVFYKVSKYGNSVGLEASLGKSISSLVSQIIIKEHIQVPESQIEFYIDSNTFRESFTKPLKNKKKEQIRKVRIVKLKKEQEEDEEEGDLADWWLNKYCSKPSTTTSLTSINTSSLITSTSTIITQNNLWKLKPTSRMDEAFFEGMQLFNESNDEENMIIVQVNSHKRENHENHTTMKDEGLESPVTKQHRGELCLNTPIINNKSRNLKHLQKDQPDISVPPSPQKREPEDGITDAEPWFAFLRGALNLSSKYSIHRVIGSNDEDYDFLGFPRKSFDLPKIIHSIETKKPGRFNTVVVAKSVETNQHVSYLIKIDSNTLQGYSEFRKNKLIQDKTDYGAAFVSPITVFEDFYPPLRSKCSFLVLPWVPSVSLAEWKPDLIPNWSPTTVQWLKGLYNLVVVMYALEDDGEIGNKDEVVYLHYLDINSSQVLITYPDCKLKFIDLGHAKVTHTVINNFAYTQVNRIIRAFFGSKSNASPKQDFIDFVVKHIVTKYININQISWKSESLFKILAQISKILKESYSISTPANIFLLFE